MLKNIKKYTNIRMVLIFFSKLLVFITSLFVFSVIWVFNTWKYLSMDELMFHINAPLEGTSTEMILAYCLKCVVPAIISLIVCIFVLLHYRKKESIFKINVGIVILSLFIVVGTGAYTWNRLDVGGYLKYQGMESRFLEKNYVSPDEVEIQFPEKKRNLIYIFLESMETTYADQNQGGAFQNHMIPELTKIVEEGEDFSGNENFSNGAYALNGATWTMGAMFAHTSGLPLKISIDANNMDTQRHFFPAIKSLGDILEKEGYSQILMVGSDADFGGRKLYFTEHGNYDIFDYNYASENKMIPKDYYVWWGFEDQKLFEFAKDQLTQISSHDEPFNFTLLTVDTHFEDGYVCPLCENKFEGNQYANVMACASKQIGSFLDWIKEQNFYENTTVVLVGDHLTMDSDFCEGIDEGYVRKVYTSIINSAVQVKEEKRREYSTFDLFPTTIASLGASIEGERLGLGTNLFSNVPTMTESMGIESLERELQKKSDFMEKLADIDYQSEELIERGDLPEASEE